MTVGQAITDVRRPFNVFNWDCNVYKNWSYELQKYLIPLTCNRYTSQYLYVA